MEPLARLGARYKVSANTWYRRYQVSLEQGLKVGCDTGKKADATLGGTFIYSSVL